MLGRSMYARREVGRWAGMTGNRMVRPWLFDFEGGSGDFWRAVWARAATLSPSSADAMKEVYRLWRQFEAAPSQYAIRRSDIRFGYPPSSAGYQQAWADLNRMTMLRKNLFALLNAWRALGQQTWLNAAEFENVLSSNWDDDPSFPMKLREVAESRGYKVEKGGIGEMLMGAATLGVSFVPGASEVMGVVGGLL